MATKKNILQNIRDHEMDRKDFLKYSGVVLIGVIGLKGLVALFEKPEAPAVSTNPNQQSSRGFGGGRYGS